MAITDSLGQTINNSNNVATYTTLSFTPTANDILIAGGGITDTTAAIGVSDSVTGAWTVLVDQAWGGGGHKAFLAIKEAPATAVARTVSATCTGDNGTGCHLACRRLGSARQTANFYRQFNFATGAGGTTPTVVLPRPVDPNNAVFGFVINLRNPATVTEPSGWGEILDNGHTTPDMGLEYARDLSGETLQTITWGSTSTVDWIAMVLEVYEVNQPTKVPRVFHHRQQMFVGSQ